MRMKRGRSEIASYVVIKGNIHDIRQFTPTPPAAAAHFIFVELLASKRFCLIHA